MKYIIILGDGMADDPIPALGNKTILQAANKPVIDYLAKINRNKAKYVSMQRKIHEIHKKILCILQLKKERFDFRKFNNCTIIMSIMEKSRNARFTGLCH